MQLLYRGLPYQVNRQAAPVISDSASQSKVRLTYRGNAYEYTPQPPACEVLPADAPSVVLVYRGQTYERKLPIARAYQRPRALNWRWQFPL